MRIDRSSFFQAAVMGTFAALLFSRAAVGQDVTVVRQISTSGIVDAIRAGQLTIVDTDGGLRTYKIQNRDQQAISVGGGELIFRAPATIATQGHFGADQLRPGLIVRFDTRVGRSGSTEGAVQQLQLLLDSVSEIGIQTGAEEDEGPVPAQVTGTIEALADHRLTVALPRSELAPKQRLIVTLADGAEVLLSCDHLDYVQSGDLVKRLQGVELSTGDFVALQVEIELKSGRAIPQPSFADQLYQRYLHLSDLPQPPRDVRSQHFLLHTDVSDRSAQVLLDKLETMLQLVSTYFRRNLPQPIECYVVRDMSQWAIEAFPEIALRQIQAGSAVSVHRALAGDRQSIVYGADDHGVIQHEAMHSYCFYVFGDNGPLWYAEGIAELARYWRPENSGVNVDPVVVDYLTHAQPKNLAEIVSQTDPVRTEWRDYAWCWALCHLLANHPDYAERFKKLGVDMMAGTGATFESAFADLAPRVAFEFDQFVTNFGNGYRVDLCAWQWNRKPRMISTARRVKPEIRANYGWQASGGQVQKGRSYEFTAEGTWKTGAHDEPVSADGGATGNGRLVAAILDGFALGEPFELSAAGTFVAPADGHIFLRCRDQWNQLADNEGAISVQIRASKSN